MYMCICIFNKKIPRFQVAMPLFSNRSQMTSKYSKNKKVAYEVQPSVLLLCHILTSSVIYY